MTDEAPKPQPKGPLPEGQTPATLRRTKYGAVKQAEQERLARIAKLPDPTAKQIADAANRSFLP